MTNSLKGLARRQMWRKAAITGPGADLVAEAMTDLLALIRAQRWSYLTSHWQASGTPYYGDHLLFQRMYEALEGEVDALAEKIVAHLGEKYIDPSRQMDQATRWIDTWVQIENHYQRGLASEEDFQAAVLTAYSILKETGHITLGLDDFLMATANAHETNQYLLQQRTAGDS